jgi:transcriptional regulator with XRE-family HTH domain
MTYISNNLTRGIAQRIRFERVQREWSLADLAERSGVSKAMLSAIERGETSPTAALLVRIASAFDMTLSSLIARAELRGGGLLRGRDQPVWTDPETGYVRQHLSPATDMPLELIRVELPEGAKVSFPAASYALIRQQIWLIEGRLEFTEGDVVHAMEAQDCLALGPPADCMFHAPGPGPAIYLVALARSQVA